MCIADVCIQKASVNHHKPSPTQREPLVTQGEPKCELVEYSLLWALLHWHRIRHVDFMLFVSFLFALGTKRERGFYWLKDVQKTMGKKKLWH